MEILVAFYYVILINAVIILMDINGVPLLKSVNLLVIVASTSHPCRLFNNLLTCLSVREGCSIHFRLCRGEGVHEDKAS